ncbi:RHS repeat protein [Flavobacterium sp. GSA192]|uniref:RHS repeat protein n=1 Tax=Flavobacterium sp. GSA192 TaxID=2576304 RepID=UPI001126B8E4|nr:RHS repeat protein [Flavobacterium sp. GSA192]
MKRLVALLFVILGMKYSFAQNQDIAFPHVVPMSPNAAEFAKYGDIPVSHYTGVPNINIPLYEIDVDGLKLPISLNYHASGIKVDQEATWVGLGWSLNVGSRISRTTNCVDDFLNGDETDYNHPTVIGGYYTTPEHDAVSQTHYDPPISYYMPMESRLIYDTEPDIFYYNLPGINGKFILDKSRGAVLFDKSHNLKIEVLRDSSVKFKITDQEGNQYFYDKHEITESFSKVGFLNKNIHSSLTRYDDIDGDALDFVAWDRYYNDSFSGSYNPYKMISSWCLSKITTRHGREITFTYDTEKQYLPTQESCENYRRNGQSYLYYYKSKIVNTALRLSKIEGDFGRVEFNCSDRLDIKGTSKKLDSFSIYNNNNTLVKSYKLDYNYFNDDYSGDSQGNLKFQHVFKRLKLNKITEYYALSQPLNKGYSFTYYDGSFPPKNSKNVDYWGFQNGKSYGENYYIGLRLLNNETYNGVKKDALFDKAIIGTLKKISYPTGGNSEFKFESNTFSSSYFEDNTYEASHTDPYSVYKNLSVFNNYISNDYVYVEYPNQDTYTFQIEQETTIKINCTLENVLGTRDLTYNYESYGNPLGELRKVSPTATSIFTYTCPPVWESTSSQPQGEGSEIILVERHFTLQPGTYEFKAYTPPRDVYAGWTLYYDKYVLPTNGVSHGPYNGGGIRIKEIVDSKIKKYKYPIGSMLVQPVLCSFLPRGGVPEFLFPQGTPLAQVSESKTPLSTFNGGNIIGYDWVEEESNFDENDNISKIKYIFYNDNESDFFDDKFPDSPRYINYTNGLIKSIEKYKCEYPNIFNTLVEKKDFTYASSFNSNIIKAFKDKGIVDPGSIVVGRKILEYYYQVEWPLRAKEVTTLSTDDGNNIISETNYSYNSKDLIQFTSNKQSTSSSINNTEIIEKIKYPFDFNDSVSASMVSKNIIGLPIEKTIFKKVGTNQEIELSKQKTVYEDIGNGVILPKKVQTSKDAAVLEDRLKYNRYDLNGNLLEVEQSNGMKVSYIWGYKSTLPVAKLENISYSNIPSDLIATIQNVTDSSIETDEQVRVALNTLRNSSDVNIQQSLITTYTYKPLVGITSMTDSKGYTVFYEYDAFNRLKKVKDQDGKILSVNDYHYKTLE